jgi:hypothetical protein
MMFGLMIPAGCGVSADFLLELMNNAGMKGEGTMAMPRLGKKKAAPARNVKKAEPNIFKTLRKAMPRLGKNGLGGYKHRKPYREQEAYEFRSKRAGPLKYFYPDHLTPSRSVARYRLRPSADYVDPGLRPKGAKLSPSRLGKGRRIHSPDNKKKAK